MCRPLGFHVITTKLVPYGKPFTMHGLLVTTQGVPIANAPVDILTAPANGLEQFTEAATATTTASGAWTAKLPPGPRGSSAPSTRIGHRPSRHWPSHRERAGEDRAVGQLPRRAVERRRHAPRAPCRRLCAPGRRCTGLLIKLPHRSQPYEPVRSGQTPRATSSSGGRGEPVSVSSPIRLAVATTATESDYPYAASGVDGSR